MLLFTINDPLQGEAYYNAYEKDIAVVNVFFGGSTVFGEEMSYQMQFKISSVCLCQFSILQNLRGLKG